MTDARESLFASRTYTLLACPICRAELRFFGNDEGLFPRAECCGKQWFYPSDANRPDWGGRPETAAVEVTVTEVAA